MFWGQTVLPSLLRHRSVPPKLKIRLNLLAMDCTFRRFEGINYHLSATSGFQPLCDQPWALGWLGCQQIQVSRCCFLWKMALWRCVCAECSDSHASHVPVLCCTRRRQWHQMLALLCQICSVLGVHLEMGVSGGRGSVQQWGAHRVLSTHGWNEVEIAWPYTRQNILCGLSCGFIAWLVLPSW